MINTRVRSLITMALVIVGAFFISWEVIGPILFDDSVVQDDFRQSLFWTWRFWDPTLFQNDFVTSLYTITFDRLPLLCLIYKLGPLFTNNLIYYGKFLALLLALVTSLYAYLFFKSLTKQLILSAAFALSMTVLLWSTDHLSAVHARSFIWLILFMYMFYKIQGANLKAFLLTALSLLLSPIAFLLCFVMEGYSLLINNTKNIFNLKSPQLQGLIFNALFVFILYKIIPVPYSEDPFPHGHIFTSTELRVLPELNIGGRHPIFGSTLGDWWTSRHWGSGIGFLKVSHLVIFAAVALTIFILHQFFFARSPIVKNNFASYVKSQLFYLFLSAITLHLVAHIVFPTLYMPSRYIGIPFLILSIALIFILTKQLLSGLPKASWFVYLSILLSLWGYLHLEYHTSYVSMNPELKLIYDTLPKDSLIAAHPRLRDINLVSVINKKRVLISYEHTTPTGNRNEDTLREIRRRNIVSLRMTYAATASELKELMKANQVTHFLVSKRFYSPQYLSNPYYIEPYNDLLKQLVAKDKFYLRDFLDENRANFAVIDYQSLN